MIFKMSRRAAATGGLALLLAGVAKAAVGQASGSRAIGTGSGAGEWPTYGGNLASWRYSPLDQVTKDNFSNLKIVWRFRADNLGPRPDFNLQATPLMVNGRIFLTAGSRRAAVALDARTGELLWKHTINEGERGRLATMFERGGSGRGLAHWTDGREERVLYVTPGYRLVALDAATGLPIPSFGTDGIVDLKAEVDQPNIDLVTAPFGLQAAPIVIGDTIIIGSAHNPQRQPNKANVKGVIRAFDIRTGKRLWIFHTIPQKGEPGSETWLRGSEVYTGNAGSWTQMSADPELGLVYVGVELPTHDYYGGNRPGAGLFGESLVALDLRTGQRRWHYQFVHHGTMDRDVPSAAVLVDLTVGGRRIKALAQPTKQAWLFVLDRETGKPVWPIPERPVPAGDVPGEWYPPTQPMVTRPPAFDRQGVSVDDLIDFTPEMRAEAVELVKSYRLGPLYTPPAFSKWPSPLGTLVLPGINGGANWPGGSWDPETNILYIYSFTQVASVGIVPVDPSVSDGGMGLGVVTPPAGASINRSLTVRGLPLIKPPYGRITAIDLNKGEIAWQTPHGETPDAVRNHPDLKGLPIPRTGNVGRVGVLTTKTLLVAGDGSETTDSDGVLSGWLRAYDKRSGAEVAKVRMPGRQTGSPMTYMLDGRQYVAVASSSRDGGQLVVYTLP